MGKKNKYKANEADDAPPAATATTAAAGAQQRNPNPGFSGQQGAATSQQQGGVQWGGGAQQQQRPQTDRRDGGQPGGSSQQQGGRQWGGGAQQQQRPQADRRDGGQPGGSFQRQGGGQWSGSAQQQQRPQADRRDGGQPGGSFQRQGGGQWSGSAQQQQRPQADRRDGGQPGGSFQRQGGGQWSGSAQQQQRPQADRRDSGQSGGSSQRQGGGQWSGHAQQQQRPQSGGQQQRSTAAVPKGQAQFHQVAKVSSGGIPRGTLGEPGQVEVNYLKMEMSKMPSTAFHYDVAVTPDRPKKFMRAVIDRFNEQFFKDYPMAFDGRKSIYTVSKLPVTNAEKEVEILDSGSRKMAFKVVIKETDTLEIDLGSLKRYQTERIYDKPMRALQCLEVVLATPCHSKGVRGGRSFYTKPEQFFDLKDGYEMWTGLFQAAILGDEPFLNVDVSHKSFPVECTILDYLKQNYRIDNLNKELDYRDAEGLRGYLKSITVVYEPPPSFNSFPKSYKVNDLTKQAASRLYFKNDQNVDISVAEYFESRGYPLRFPNLNCVHVGARDKTNYIPIELLRVPPGQALNKKDGARQVQQMIRYAATSTDERKSKVMRMLAYFNHNSNDTIRKFGIQIGATFIEVPMRLMKPPHLEYYAGQTVLPYNGSWRLSDSNKFLLTKQPQGQHKWAIIYSGRSRTNMGLLVNFSKMIYKSATKLNMSLQEKPTINTFNRIDDMLRQMKTEKYDLVIVVVPNFGTTYAEIKQCAELKHGILTQCIKEMTIERRLDDQLVFNLMLKVNSKLNGTNHKIATNPFVKLQNVMFMGADVTHPSPDQREVPSVVGVAATHDELGACYNMQYRIQKSTVENIEDMDSIVTHHLQVYFRYQKRYPDQIIYYRDGVSDGQFPIVRRNELTGIRAACNKLRIQPKLTCIIVVKRHHTRFFPNTKADRNNKFNNVVPGTVVDQVIVHPNEVQFFMVSHQSIQGTAKPTRYNVIHDEAKMHIDVIQSLTHYLCHMFPRCNRAVSYPAPAYLAHLVASRGRVYLEGLQLSSNTNLAKEYEKRTINTNFLSSNPMYFV